MDKKTFIAKRVAQELRDGYVVNLGIGLPTMVANFVPKGMHVTFQAENGMLGVGPAPEPGSEDKDYINAGGAHVTALPGAVFFDSATSFGIIRGRPCGHDRAGRFAGGQNRKPRQLDGSGEKGAGHGGAMDLVVGAKRVIVAMEHTAKGNHKILEECSFPLTAASVVDRHHHRPGGHRCDGGRAGAARGRRGRDAEDVQAATGAPLTVDPNLKVMHVEE